MDDTRSSRFGSYRETRGFLFVALISTVFIGFVTPLQPQGTSGRSIILEEIMEDRQQKSNESSRLIPCFLSFIDDYFEVPGWVSIVLPDELQYIPSVATSLISELRKKMAIYMLQVEMISVINTYEGAADPIILSENATILKGKDLCMANYCKHDCDFMLVLTTPYADEKNFLAEVDELIQDLCMRSIFELRILALVGDSAVVAGSPLSRTNGSYTVVNASILSRCEQGDAGAVQWKDSFEEWIRSSLGEVIVNTALFPNFPYSKPEKTPSGLKFKGIEGTMVEEIALNRKVQLNREVIELNNTDNELKLRLYENMSSDLIFGGFLWSYDPKVEYTNSYGMVHITWIVPIYMNVSLRGLITPFSAIVWCAIICSLIIGVLVKHFFIRDISTLDIVALLLGIVTNRQPVKISSRIQYISWVLFGFFVTQLYLGSLADQLMNASVNQINTLDELIDSGLKIGGTAQLFNLLNVSDSKKKLSKDDHKIRQIVNENYIIFEEDVYNELIVNITEGKNSDLALLVMLNLTSVRHKTDVGYSHIVKETLGTYPLALATWRGFPYLKDINFEILVLLQTGIIEFWSNMIDLSTYYYTNDLNNNNLDIKDIAPAFLLLIIGFVGGCLLLIVEILFYPSRFLS